MLFDVIENLLEVGVLLVHLGHEQNPGHPQPVTVLPDPLGPHLDAARAREHHHRRVRNRERRSYLPVEIEQAGGVEQIDLRAHPLGKPKPETDRVLALDLVGRGVGERGAVFDGAVALGGTGDEGECID